MESSQMPLPSSCIYATYLFKNKFKAFKYIIKIARKRVDIFVSMPKKLVWTQQQVDSM
jgi:hypothetical protein